MIPATLKKVTSVKSVAFAQIGTYDCDCDRDASCEALGRLACHAAVISATRSR